MLNASTYHLKLHLLVESEFVALDPCSLEVGIILDPLAIWMKQVNFTLVCVQTGWISMEHVTMYRKRSA